MLGKRKRPFTLGVELGSNMMEDYQRDGKIISSFYPLDRKDSIVDEETKLRIQEFRKNMRKMKTNPRQYFNFGFTVNDYIQYTCKHYFMRLERDMIRRSGETYSGKQ